MTAAYYGTVSNALGREVVVLLLPGKILEKLTLYEKRNPWIKGLCDNKAGNFNPKGLIGLSLKSSVQPLCVSVSAM